MLTGGTIFGTGSRTAEWVGNAGGCGIMNHMVQFDDYDYSSNSHKYYTVNWGSRNKLSLFLSA